MIPWKNGRLLVWDATCPDTFAPSYRCHATSTAGAVATLAEERKASKYSCLVPSHSFTPVAIESMGTATYWLYQEVNNYQSLYSNMNVDALKYLLFKFNIYEISGRVLLHCVYTL